ncbi:MAG: GspH/FimT family pseudopilin [Gammaproteobacteria bacterium]|jgi:type IV fimbrial biogenesis protein FimT
MRRIRGFTLIELLTTVVIAVILITVAVPGFRTMILNNRITTASNTLVGFLNAARANAIREGRTVTVCVDNAPGSLSCSGTDWASGWKLWVDRNSNGSVDSGEVVRTQNAMASDITIAASGFANSTFIQYLPNGMSGSSGDFTVCDSSRTGESGVKITVGPTGQVLSSTVTCS